ncbi:MAG: hypothetical protein H6878_05055 [Rhodobiaceae bacterium]|nr:hypothetical protein [Rhodobiaceae bacterium]MCC0015659.1 hypothetical protein [Rhodobiaceae bacterium]
MSDQIMALVMTTISALAALFLFVGAVRTSYEIEQRSDGTILWKGLPRYTNMFRTAFGGASVAKDEETRALVNRLRKQLLLTFTFLALMGLTACLNMPPAN